MNKRTLFLLLFFFAPWSLCLATTVFGLEAQAATLTAGIVFEDNYPLVYFDTSDTPQGFEVDMVHHLAKAGGYELGEIRIFPDHNALYLALESHHIDFAFSKMKRNVIDAQRFIYSKPYLTIEYVFLLHRAMMAQNGIQVDPLRQLAKGSLPVGTLENPIYAEQLRRSYPDMQIKVFSSKKAVLDALMAGEITACYLDELEANHFFLSSPAKALYLKYMRARTVSDAVALVFPWDTLFFREWVNIFLTKEGYTDVTLSDIMQRTLPGEAVIQRH